MTRCICAFLLALAVASATVPIPAQLCYDPDTDQIAYCYYTNGIQFTRAQPVAPAPALTESMLVTMLFSVIYLFMRRL